MEGLELHHIIFRSQASYMVNVKVNFVYLTPEAHRGNNSPHKSRKKDLEYKKELQAKLNKMFCKDYYTLEQIKEILEISRKEAESIVKTLRLTKGGYSRLDVIQRCLGGRFYE